MSGSAAQPALATPSVNIIYLLLGLYGWEYIQSLGFVEYAVIRRRLPFRWPLIPYIAGRACMLVYLILFAVKASSVSGNMTCLPSVLLTSLSGNITLGCSSAIFMLRTWAIWNDSLFMHILLSLLTLGHWTALVLDTAVLRSTDANGICEVYLIYPQINAATVIYTTSYDLLVFALSVVGLSRQRSKSPLKKCLRVQGILYVAVAGIASIPAMVSALLNRSCQWCVDDIADKAAIAMTASTIASSRAVRSLLAFDTSQQGEILESNVTLTTQIVIQPSMSMVREDISGGPRRVDEADSC